MQFTDVVTCRPAVGLVPGTAVGQAGTCPRPVARLWRRGLAMLAMALVPLLSAAPEARAELLIGNLNIGTATGTVLLNFSGNRQSRVEARRSRPGPTPAVHPRVDPAFFPR